MEVLRRDRTWEEIQWIRAEINVLNDLVNMFNESPGR